MRQSYAEVERSLRYKKCLRHPARRLVVQIVDSQYVPWCHECYLAGYSGPALGRDDPVAERKWDMMTREMARQPGQVLATLQKSDIKQWIAPRASDQELEIFIRFCQAQRLNPFAHDVYLIPFEQRDKDGKVTGTHHSIVIGLQAYLKRAARNPLYQSYQSGLIVKRGDHYEDTVGTIGYPGDELYGAWCRVWKKGAPVPFEQRVALTAWNKGRNVWATQPGVMIEVTAIRQCIRRAFPEEFGPEDAPQEVEGMAVEVVEDASVRVLVPTLPAQLNAGASSPGGSTGSRPTAPAAPAPAAPPACRFHSVNEFWDAVEQVGWGREQVADALGGSLGQWLSFRMKEQGHPATWDEAYAFLSEKLGMAEGTP